MKLKDFISNDLKVNRDWYFLLFLVPLVFFFFDFSNVSFTQDELRRHSSYIVDPQWLSQGRFGMYFLTMLYSNNPVFPYFGTILSLVVSAISIRFFFERVCGEHESKALILILFVSCPFAYYIYSFSTVSFSVGFIYLFNAFAIYFSFVKKCKLNYIVSILFLSASVSIYQSAITIYILMALIVIFLKCEKGNNYRYVVISLGKVFLILSLSLFLYAGLNKIISFFISGNESGYIDGFVRFDLSFLYLFEVLKGLILRAKLFLGASDVVLPQKNIFQSISLFLMCLVILVKYHYKFLTMLTLLFFIMLSPFLLEVMSTNAMPARSYIALPLLFSFVFFWLWTRVSHHFLSNIIVINCIVYVCVNFMNITKFSFYEYSSWEKDKRFAAEMVSQIFSLDGIDGVMKANKGKIPLHSVGFSYDNDSIAFQKQFENIGRGFFSWGDNELQNSSNLFKSLGWSEFSYAYPEQVKPYINEIRALPNWPHPDSIKIIGDFVVIKLSDYSEAQNITVCANSTAESCLVSYNPKSIRFNITFDDDVVDGHSVLYRFGLDGLGQIKNSQVAFPQGGGYLISSPIADPFIVIPELNLTKNHNENVILFLDMNYYSPQSLSLYFRDGRGGGYSESRVMRFNPMSGHVRMYITIPADLVESGLRIDLLNSKAKVKLNDLVIYE